MKPDAYNLFRYIDYWFGIIRESAWEQLVENLFSFKTRIIYEVNECLKLCNNSTLEMVNISLIYIGLDNELESFQEILKNVYIWEVFYKWYCQGYVRRINYYAQIAPYW